MSKCRSNLGNWYPWFAWYPVEIENEYVWLETVERKVDVSGQAHARMAAMMSPFDTEYRNIEVQP
jgi:hypothetical protein